MRVLPGKASDEWVTDVYCECQQESDPRVSHRHGRKLPDEHHDPILYGRVAFVPQDCALQTFHFAICKSVVKVLFRRKIVKNRLRLDRRDDGPDSTQE